jgi:PAS domain S-box-containing protein
VTTRRGTPLTVYLFIVGLAASATLAASVAEPWAFAAPAWVMLPLALTLVAAGMIQLEFHWRGQREALDLFEAALVPLIAVFAGPGAIALTALTKLISQRVLRIAPLKASFNIAQWAASAGAASLIYQALAEPDRVDIVAMFAAVGVAALINHVAVAVVLALVQRKPFREVLRGLAPVLVPGWLVSSAMNICFGMLFAVVIVHQPELSVLFLVPLGLFGWAQRAYSEVLIDRTRVAALQQATHTLAGAEGTALAALPEALEAIRAAFEAAAVVVVIDGEDTVHEVHAGDEVAAVTAIALARDNAGRDVRRISARDGSRDGTMLSLVGRRCALVAPLVASTTTIGALVSIDRSGLDGFDDGELAVFQALASEITGAIERSELHAALVNERSHLLEIVERSSDGIFSVGQDGAVVDWNPAMAAITGFASPSDGGGRVAALLRAHTGAEEVRLQDWRVVGIENLPAEIEILTRIGETRTLACSYAEVSNPLSLVVMARDVTRQREVDRLKDDFVATVSHELRTPLTSIVGFTSMLLEPPRELSDAEHENALTMIRKGARRLERLIFNLLEVSRIEHGSMEMPGPIDVLEACENAIAEVAEAYPTREIRLVASTGAVQAIGNQLSVEQILTNLLGNALKYSERGPIEIVVSESPESLTISVTDQGPGIPLAEQERVFDRFHRMDQHHVQAGTGLGLYISRQLATTMGAELTVTSELHKGSTFSLTLPGELHLTAVG